MRNCLAILAVALFSVTFGTGAGAAGVELVMFETAGCEWCERWHKEVGEIYPNTTESEIAPLRRVDLDQPIPADLGDIRGVRYTPTFVLVEDGREVGRILGYPGEAFFWGLLGIELKKLAPVAKAACESVAASAAIKC